MRVLEFKANFTKQQRDLIDGWLEPSRHLWNITLNQFEKLERYFYYHKGDKKLYPVSPIPWQYRYIYLNLDGSRVTELTKSEKDNAIAATGYRDNNGVIEWFIKVKKQDKWLSSTEIGKGKIKYLAAYMEMVDRASLRYIKHLPEVKLVTTEKGKLDDESVYTSADLTWMRGWKGEGNCTGYSCPMGLRSEPVMQTTSFTGAKAPTLIIRRDILPELIKLNLFPVKDENGNYVYPDLLSIPYEYAQGLIKNFCVSWQEYTKSRVGVNQLGRGKPKYKSAKDVIDTLCSGKSNTAYISGRDEIKLPRLGAVKVPGLSDRWVNSDGSVPEKINTFKIVRRASGYYLQLTGEITRSPRLCKAEKATAIDPGLKSYLAFEDGRQIENPRYLRKAEAKLAKLQQMLAAKLSHNLILWLCNPKRTVEDIKEICPNISERRATSALGLKTEAEIVEAIGKSYANKLKWKVGYSKRCAAIEKRISLLHEKVKMQRKAFIEKQSTWIVRKHQTIVIEEGMQSAKLRKKAKAKFNQEGNKFDRNNAKAKSGMSKSLADGGHGAFISAVERKAETTGRNFIKYPAYGTTQNCPVCETSAEIDLSVRWYKCEVCGFECDRDQKSGIYMLVHCYEKGMVPKECLTDVVLKALSDREQWNAREGGCKNGKTTRKRKK